MSAFSERLKEIRKKMDLDQIQFAEFAGVSRNTQINYESGKRSPDVEYLTRLATANVDIRHLLTGESTLSASDLSAAEQSLVSAFRGMTAEQREAISYLSDQLAAGNAQRGVVPVPAFSVPPEAELLAGIARDAIQLNDAAGRRMSAEQLAGFIAKTYRDEFAHAHVPSHDEIADRFARFQVIAGGKG